MGLKEQSQVHTNLEMEKSPGLPFPSYGMKLEELHF